MGHLVRMANYIVDFGKQGKNATRLQELFQKLPEEVTNQWINFVENKITPANRNNEILPVTVSFFIIACILRDILNILYFSLIW